jgi:hypothetical protein
MELQDAQSQLIQLLNEAVAALQFDFNNAPKSPVKALLKFKAALNGPLIPILFRRHACELENSLRGIMRTRTFKKDTSALLIDCALFAERVRTELRIDIAEQIKLAFQEAGQASSEPGLSLSLPEAVDFRFRYLEPEVSEVVKEVIKSLVIMGNLDCSKFSSVREISSWSGFENRFQWERSCQELLTNITVDSDTEVIGWIGSEVVAFDWEQVLRNWRLLFADNYILPQSVAWVLFLFHEDSLEFGVR